MKLVFTIYKAFKDQWMSYIGGSNHYIKIVHILIRN